MEGDDSTMKRMTLAIIAALFLVVVVVNAPVYSTTMVKPHVDPYSPGMHGDGGNPLGDSSDDGDADGVSGWKDPGLGQGPQLIGDFGTGTVIVQWARSWWMLVFSAR
jgi:hypothetical protein